MEQTAKIAKVRENVKSYTTANGTLFVHVINVEGDPQDWEYHAKTDKCLKFIPGVEATFTTEIKQNGNFTNYRIKPSDMGAPKNFGGGKFKDNKDQEVITALSIYSSTMNGLQGSMDVKDWAKVKERCEEAYQWAMSKSKK